MSLFSLPDRYCVVCGDSFNKRKGEKAQMYTRRNHCDEHDTGEKINRPGFRQRGYYRKPVEA